MNNLIAALAFAWNLISQPLLALITTLIVLLIGFVIARFIGFIITHSLKLIQLDKWTKTIKLNSLLEKGEIKKSLADLMGDIVYWLIIFVTVIGAAKLFGLQVEPVLAKLLIYLGLALMVALVLGLGLFLASLIANLVKMITLNFGIEGGKSLARFIYYVVILFTLLAALSQLGLRPSTILGKLDIVLGTVGLAAAIAFGLGCKDMAADFLYGIFKGK
jgi:small-conductance mechanosensitive channel